MSRGKLTKWIRALKKLDIPRSWRDIGRERMGFEAVRLLLKAVRGAISQIGRLASGKYRRRGNALQPMLGDGRISERRLRRATQQAERKALIATCAASEDKAAAPDQRRAVGLRRRFSQGAM